MGLQCIKAVVQHRQSQICFKSDGLEDDLRHSKDIVNFYIKINNLRLLDFSQVDSVSNSDFSQHTDLDKGSFFCDDFLKRILKTGQNMDGKCYLIQSRNYWTAELKIPINLISNKVVSISILDRQNYVLDQLNIKLYHLSTGPIKHDHLLKSLKSRLLFDFHVDQYLNIEVFLNDFQILWKNPQNYSEYSYFLSLMFSNTKNHIEATKKYEKHQKIKGWGLQKIKVKNSDLFESIIKLKMAKSGNGKNEIQCFIPYSKFMQQNIFKTKTNQVGSCQERQLTLKQDLYISGQNVGSIKVILGITKSKLYAQQMDCVIFSENGIVMATPTEFLEQEKELDIDIILKFYTQLKTGKKCGITDFQFYQLMESVCMAIKKKEFIITDNLFKTQQILLDFMLQLSQCIQQDRILRNQYIWKILHDILHKKIMSLKYFGSIRDETSKKKYALKIYKLITNTISKIIGFIENGISYKELNYIQRFIAFAFFRLSWCQSKIIQALQRNSDPLISEDKLGQLGASYAMRSPSKSYFYDYSSNILKYIQREQQYLKLIKNLDQSHEANPKWPSLLFDRQYQQLFYGLYSQLWDQAQIFLINNGKIMWEYFPKYGDLLSIFLGQMNSNGLTDFSDQMTKCNMKLIKNQKLLNTFMMLIFPKTCLYETYCVLKCLDLINCYFSVILNNNQKLPIDFNYNYFYSGIRCILQSSHTLLLQKMLAMIYKYYNIFNKDFKQTLNHYINCRVFNQIFMHWSHNVRNIFHYLLIFRIAKYEKNENPQIMGKNGKISFESNESYDSIIENLYSIRGFKNQTKQKKVYQKSQLYERMKEKLKKKRKNHKENSPVSFFQNEEIFLPSCNQSIDLPFSPTFVRRKWSVTVSFQQQQQSPSDQQLKYLDISLKEYQLAKLQKNPDSLVDQRSKMLQKNVDQ